MKVIKKLYLLLVLYLTVGLAQTCAFEMRSPTHQYTQIEMKNIIKEMINVLEESYIYPEKTTRIKNALNELNTSKRLNKIEDLEQFSIELSLICRRVSGDNYLNVTKAIKDVAIGTSSFTYDQKESENLGFSNVEILSGNIGYVKVNHLYQHKKAEEKATQVFSFLSSADAIIIDLREVEGESISLAQFIMSFFTKKNTVLLKVLYDRQEKTQTLKSLPKANIEKFKKNYPLYILTSPFVSGSGELLSYTLKHLNKAVVIGNKTMGVAAISTQYKIEDLLSIEVPIAIPLNPVTNANWEGEGVIPDIEVNSAQSFDIAYKVAKSHLGYF